MHCYVTILFCPCLFRLTTLLLHSNQLTELPLQFGELKHLSTLVIAFNRFFQLPKGVKELPALRTLIASGNYIRLLIERHVEGLKMEVRVYSYNKQHTLKWSATSVAIFFISCIMIVVF